MASDSAKFLESRGWHTWYNPNYWVNKKCVKDPSAQDYTNYGMPLEEALRYEREGRGSFDPTPLAGLMGGGAALNNYNRGKKVTDSSNRPIMNVVYKKKGEKARRVMSCWAKETEYGLLISAQPQFENDKYGMSITEALEAVAQQDGFLNVYVNKSITVTEDDDGKSSMSVEDDF